MLEKMGYTKTENQKEADLALFNTCCVRENAEDKLFGKLGELKKIKEERGTIIAIIDRKNSNIGSRHLQTRRAIFCVYEWIIGQKNDRKNI